MIVAISRAAWITAYVTAILGLVLIMRLGQNVFAGGLLLMGGIFTLVGIAADWIGRRFA